MPLEVSLMSIFLPTQKTQLLPPQPHTHLSGSSRDLS